MDSVKVDLKKIQKELEEIQMNHKDKNDAYEALKKQSNKFKSDFRALEQKHIKIQEDLKHTVTKEKKNSTKPG